MFKDCARNKHCRNVSNNSWYKVCCRFWSRQGICTHCLENIIIIIILLDFGITFFFCSLYVVDDDRTVVAPAH